MGTGSSGKSSYSYYGSGKCYEIWTRVAKVFAYVLFSALVLGGAILSKGAMLLMTSAISDNARKKAERDRWTLLLLISICFPYFYTFLECLVKCCMGKRPWPSLCQMIGIMLVESAQTVGVSLFVFRVLPSCDAIRAVLLMNAVCLIPGIFKVFFARSKATGCTRLFVFLVDIVAVVFQVTVFFIVLGTHYVSDEKAEGTNLMDSMKNFINNLSQGDIKVAYRLPWEAVAAVVLISIPWWENFMDANCNRLHQFAENMKKVRVKAYIFVSLWKIGLTLACSFLFLNGGGDTKFHNIFLLNPILPMTTKAEEASTVPSRNVRSLLQNNIEPDYGLYNSDEYPHYNYDDEVPSSKPTVDLWLTLSTYLPVFVQALGSLLCYYFGKLACKVCMQRIGFALPLSLATPITIGIFIGICGSEPTHKLFDGNFQWTCHGKLDQGMFMWHLGIGLALWWLSQLWIAGHIWIAKNERLASTESLFVLPRYESSVIEQSMMLNRRRTDYFDRKLLRHPDEEEPDVTQSGACCCGGPRTAVKDGEEVRQEIMAPKILLCSTMWHENEKEMLALLKSIFNMDADQSARRLAQEYFAIRDPDYYEFEAHVFFDDAMEENAEGERTFNKYVSTLVETVDRAASAVHQTVIEIAPPIKTPTPYGGRLTWFMPGGNTLVVHMKDKKKSRVKKRWSQVMYMYFLLGYRLMGKFQHKLVETLTQDKLRRGKKSMLPREDGMFFKDLLGPQNVLQAENTFILAVDGDVTFKPDAVRLLVDRMRKNKNVGAASGRIHPIGSGPMIWYQKFEYATGYWLQKATEHMLGCVLCAPGCFSLYRASSLLDDNVMKKYTSVADEANQILQWDLGEDRWLCTLLLERGYRVEYCAAADCLTHAPKSFTEFFKQRRRWIPSTLANIVEIIINYKYLIKINQSISIWYILYQIFYVMSTILGPATIIIAIADALNAVTDNSLWSCFAQAALPAIIFVVVCYLPLRQETQIFGAGVIGTYYAIQMMVVIVGTLVRVVDGSWRTTGVMFVVVLVLIFVCTALLHPMEISCIYPLMIYFLCIPIGYILVIIYSLCNLHVSEWGTREDIGKKQEEEDYQQVKKAKAIVEMIDDGRSQTVSDALLRQVLIILERIEKQEMLARMGLSDDDDPLSRQAKELSAMGEISLAAQEMIYSARPPNKLKRDDLRNPFWINEKVLRDGKIRFLDEKELQFWTKMIAKYLRPFPCDRRQEKKVKEEFKVLRDRLSFAFLMFNALWMALVFPLMLVHERLADTLYVTIPLWIYDNQIQLEPLGLVHLIFFAVILGIQFVSMLWHRWGTFLHILAFTEFKKKQEKFAVEQVVDAVKELQQIKGLEEDDEFPLPDYSDSDENDTSFPEDSNVDYESDARGGNIPDEHHYASIDAQIIADNNKKGASPIVGGKGPAEEIAGKPVHRSHRRHRKGKDKRSYSKSFTKNSLDLAFKRRWYAYTQRSFREEAHGRRSIEDVFADQQQLPPGISVLQELKSKMKSDGTPNTPLPVRGADAAAQKFANSRNDLNDLHHS